MHTSLDFVPLVLLAGVFLSPASAQPTAPPPRFHTSVSWAEVNTGTLNPVPSPNGILEPGESAFLRLSLEFSPGVGQPTRHFLTGVGWIESPVAGFHNTVFDVFATGADGGSWGLAPSQAGFPPTLGFVVPQSGSLLSAGAYQPVPSLGNAPLPTNPLPNLWCAVWTPPSHSPRITEFRFQSAAPAGMLFVELASAPSGFHGVEVPQMTFGTVHIPIAPAPASCIPFLALGFSTLRRTRRRT
jgi:hypothetical protein